MAVNTIQAQLRLITVEEYDQMVKAGVFPEDDRIELIEGQITTMSPIGASHAGHVIRLNRIFAGRVASQALVSIQNPIRLPRSEPQPDITLLKPRADDYTTGHPTPRDVFLVIEVSDTSAEYDRTVKIPLYGRNGIVEAWLIDIEQRVVEVHRRPNSSGYKEKNTYSPGEFVSPQSLPDIRLPVAEILGVEA